MASQMHISCATQALVRRQLSQAEISDTIWKTAMDILSTNNNHRPNLFTFTVGRMTVMDVAALMWNVDSKNTLSRFIHDTSTNGDVYAIALITEAWIVKCGPNVSTDQAKQITPSEHPDRQEILQLTVEIRGSGGTFMRTADIIRGSDEKIISIGKPKDSFFMNSQGRFCGFFPVGQA